MRTLCPAPVETADGLGYCNRPILADDMCVRHLNEAFDKAEDVGDVS